MRGLSRSLSLSPRAKRTLSTIEKTKINVHLYVSKDVLTFGIRISGKGVNPDFFSVLYSQFREEITLLTPNFLASQILQDHWENRKHPCLT